MVETIKRPKAKLGVTMILKITKVMRVKHKRLIVTIGAVRSECLNALTVFSYSSSFVISNRSGTTKPPKRDHSLG